MENDLPDTKPFANFEWVLALRYLRARRKESFISVISLFSFLGIMLGVATLIVVMSVLNGFRAELLDKILGFSGHATFYHQDLTPISDFKEVQARLEKVDGVKRVISLVEGQAMASSLKSSTGVLVRGIAEADIEKLSSINNKELQTAITSPGIPDLTPSFAGFDKSEGIAVGERLAWRHQLGLGSVLTIISPNGPDTVMGTAPRIRDFTVVAIFKIGMSEYDEGIAYLPLADAQEFFVSEEGATGLEVMVNSPDDIEEIVPALRKAAGPELWMQTWKDRNVAFFNALAVERNVMFLVLTMIILVAALNIISGLIMLVKDKGHDIAILRTMGATRGAVQRVFLITGAAIGVVGTFAGLILGILICLNVESIRKFVQWLSGVDPFNAEIYYLAQLPAVIDYTQTFWIVIMSLFLSFIATLYPSWRAAKLDPVEALRYE
ncbi:MAG TPA: lipoprotein-releasing ABC transporter permease subunit [Aestuariivirga sp.]